MLKKTIFENDVVVVAAATTTTTTQSTTNSGDHVMVPFDRATNNHLDNVAGTNDVMPNAVCVITEDKHDNIFMADEVTVTKPSNFDETTSNGQPQKSAAISQRHAEDQAANTVATNDSIQATVRVASRSLGTLVRAKDHEGKIRQHSALSPRSMSTGDLASLVATLPVRLHSSGDMKPTTSFDEESFLNVKNIALRAYGSEKAKYGISSISNSTLNLDAGILTEIPTMKSTDENSPVDCAAVLREEEPMRAQSTSIMDLIGKGSFGAVPMISLQPLGSATSHIAHPSEGGSVSTVKGTDKRPDSASNVSGGQFPKISLTASWQYDTFLIMSTWPFNNRSPVLVGLVPSQTSAAISVPTRRPTAPGARSSTWCEFSR